MNDLQAKSTNTLALCPFCGGEAEMLTAESMNGGYLFGIMCNDCRSRGDVYDTEAEAIAAWNSRVKRYPESLAQRMIVDGYEHELFELRNNYEHKLSELRQQLEKQQQIVHIAIKPLEEDSTLRIDDDGNMSLEAWKNIKAWNTRVDYHGYEKAAIEAWESIKAWNSRAERTCEFNIKDNMNETEGMGDVWIECSTCHCVYDYFADDWLMKMSYCPNCGAKVIGG